MLELIALNVRRLRTGRRLSQYGLARLAGVSAPSIANIECARNMPRDETLQAIAKALNVKFNAFFIPVNDLERVRFRYAKRIQNRANILADLSRWIDDFNSLEKLLKKEIPFKLKDIKASKDVIETAMLCRKELNLNSSEPIYNISNLFNNAGIKICNIPSASTFLGLSIDEKDRGPIIAVNGWSRISVEDRIFSVARELGHLIMHKDSYDVTLTKENRKEFNHADLFAEFFLMPDKGFKKEWKNALGLNPIDRVFKVKRIFRVGYKTVLTRLNRDGAANDSVLKTFNSAYKKRFNLKVISKNKKMINFLEPFGLKPFDFLEERLTSLVIEAISGKEISIGRGAEILNIKFKEMKNILKEWDIFK